MAGMATSPEELANHLAFLHIDLTDPEFHHFALEQARVFQRELERIIGEAVTAGELRPCATGRLARLVQEMLHGALIAWAIHREGTARDWLRREFEALLEPYIADSLVLNKRGSQRSRARKRLPPR
jgi:hypothetical protein